MQMKYLNNKARLQSLEQEKLKPQNGSFLRQRSSISPRAQILYGYYANEFTQQQIKSTKLWVKYELKIKNGRFLGWKTSTDIRYISVRAQILDSYYANEVIQQ